MGIVNTRQQKKKNQIHRQFQKGRNARIILPFNLPPLINLFPLLIFWENPQKLSLKPFLILLFHEMTLMSNEIFGFSFYSFPHLFQVINILIKTKTCIPMNEPNWDAFLGKQICIYN